jgi:alkylation response protein AidB-like acyl-CoA dehydrogenase
MSTYLSKLESVLPVVSEYAASVDTEARFPREAVDALRGAGLLGLMSAEEVGGMGCGIDAGVEVISRLAACCGSTAMVVCMHYCGTAVIESFGEESTRRAIASGSYLTTLAFSEAGSRSHFWAPLSEAKQVEGGIALTAQKSWVTSAREVDGIVWSSQPVAAEGPSTIWLVPRRDDEMKIPGPFDGLGLRGNDSAPISVEGFVIPENQRLGEDGGGFDIMMGTVLPYFNLMNAACSLGLMEAGVQRSARHVEGTDYKHLQTSLRELPTIRAYVARMRIKTDMVRALLNEAVSAVMNPNDATMLKVLEVKAAAGESATEVLDIAMRVCGGAAFRKEVGVERLFRDARAATVMAPTTDVLYDFIGKAVTNMPLF